MSVQPTTHDEIGKALSTHQPLVEIYVEYPGPEARFAGPPALLVHLDARGDTSGVGKARISVSPGVFREMPHAPKRVLASLGGEIPLETARARLAILGSALSGGDPKFTGCLSPIRVRAIRADRSVLEKIGCRSQDGWPRAVSDAVSEWLAVK